ncbi:hypothetical protein PVAND_004611 [Polypedilum vanderplanki]|uniref:ZAD domain-containing protein n=1 Tax=Polypedilum vanderplanki TaxID=319348 RepID=A0A9J6BY33_POLVA|nr:hypothetical protein PVAND_004611 [Polypedilum vanderplanki]
MPQIKEKKLANKNAKRCCCCLKVFRKPDKGIEMTEMYITLFSSFFDFDLPEGKICSECSHNLVNFDAFLKDINTKHNQYSAAAVPISIIKDESQVPVSEISEENRNEIDLFEEENPSQELIEDEEQPKNTKRKQILKPVDDRHAGMVFKVIDPTKEAEKQKKRQCRKRVIVEKEYPFGPKLKSKGKFTK